MPQGYYRHPTIHQDTIVFVSEDDLWIVPASGGVARRLTSNLGLVSRPSFSPDGSRLAFVGWEEGQAEIYLMPATGGPAHRLTYLGGSQCLTAGWTADGEILFAANAAHWEERVTEIYRINPAGGAPEKLPWGPARSLVFGPNGALLLERSYSDPAHWKRYRGGMGGQLWVDLIGSGEFQRLLPNLVNLSDPMWLRSSQETDAVQNDRIYFLSDYEGAGNLYSCLPSGDDLRRHSDHEDYYARNASTDGLSIVYHAGGDLYRYDPEGDHSRRIEIEYYSPRVQRNRKFVTANRYLEYAAAHPRGLALAVTVRGKLFSFYNWEGAVIQHAEAASGTPPAAEKASADESPAAATPDDANMTKTAPQAPPDRLAAGSGIRYRLPEWLPDGRRLLAITDAAGEETFVIFDLDPDGAEPVLLPRQEFGRAQMIAVHPHADRIVYSNHRYELLFLDLETGELRVIDRGKAAPISGFCWSPDGEWVAYSVSVSLEVEILKLWHASTGEITELTRPVLRDIRPFFDPLGRYLYFLSLRTFNPVYDALHFEISFQRGMRPYLITLQKDIPSPFILKPPKNGSSDTEFSEQEAPPIGDEDAAQDTLPETYPQVKANDTDSQAQLSDSAPPPTEAVEPSKSVKPLQIDLEGIQERVLAFPVAAGVYGRITATAEGKVLYSRYPSPMATDYLDTGGNDDQDGEIVLFSFEDLREETLISGVQAYFLSADRTTLFYYSANGLRVLKAGDKPNNETRQPSRRSGWVDLGRVKAEILPSQEWRQMFREAWRLQRDQFWTEDMSQVDWLGVYERYLPLVERVGSRSEFSDLMWEMQGELGTSHAYESGGDYRPTPRYNQGRLGANFEFDPRVQAWRITHIYRGDLWAEDRDSPLHLPGINAQVGDYLLAINGNRLTLEISPDRVLVNMAGEEVRLTLASAVGDGTGAATWQMRRSVIVPTLQSDAKVKYREWVDGNRELVHRISGGRVGYVHIPDMELNGYAEFHRGFLAEVDRGSLIIDVRFNRGGHVSSLILEKLARRQLAYTTSRWAQLAAPYPSYAISGPIIALTNELASSDGDIFSHAFKLMKIGPLIGTRTWGGVIGIESNRLLVDGTQITQPEYATWFSDVGLELENFGARPDIEVEIRPQDYARGSDPQLERAIAEALRLLQENPPTTPDFTRRPSRAAPKLPPD